MPNHIVQNEKEYHIPVRTVSLIVYAQTRFLVGFTYSFCCAVFAFVIVYNYLWIRANYFFVQGGLFGLIIVLMK